MSSGSLVSEPLPHLERSWPDEYTPFEPGCDADRLELSDRPPDGWVVRWAGNSTLRQGWMIRDQVTGRWCPIVLVTKGREEIFVADGVIDTGATRIRVWADCGDRLDFRDLPQPITAQDVIERLATLERSQQVAVPPEDQYVQDSHPDVENDWKTRRAQLLEEVGAKHPAVFCGATKRDYRDEWVEAFFPTTSSKYGTMVKIESRLRRKVVRRLFYPDGGMTEKVGEKYQGVVPGRSGRDRFFYFEVGAIEGYFVYILQRPWPEVKAEHDKNNLKRTVT